MGIDRRVENLIKDYGEYPKIDLERRIHQISRKLGGQNVKAAINLLESNNLYDLCRFLLENYYDKMYRVAYDRRNSKKEEIKVTDETNEQVIETILAKV
jgi:tRNA 2-selenouridine synthase